MGCIRIPRISANLPIYHTTSQETLQKGVGHLQGAGLPVGGESRRCPRRPGCRISRRVLHQRHGPGRRKRPALRRRKGLCPQRLVSPDAPLPSHRHEIVF